MAIDPSAVLAAALDETLQHFAGTEALTEDARHTLFADFTQKLCELGAEAAMYDVIESSVPDRPAEPSWDDASPREQAQWLMNEAADVMVPEEKDPYALRAMTYLLMSIDDRLGAMQGPPRRPSFLDKGPDSTNWAVGDAVLVPGRRALGQLAQIGQIDQLHYPFGAQASGIAQIILANGDKGQWPIDVLQPAPPRGSASAYVCTWCQQTRLGGLVEDGSSCKGCETYSKTGVHGDTCPYRVRTGYSSSVVDPSKQTATVDEGLLTEYRWVVGDRVITPAGNIGKITRISEGTHGMPSFADIRTERDHNLHIRIEKLRPASTSRLLGATDAMESAHNAAVALQLAAEAMESVVRSSALSTPDLVLLTERAATCRRALVTR